MAKVALTNAYISINSVALSSRGVELSIDYTADEQDQTTFGDAYHNYLPSTLKNCVIDVTFAQDFAASNPDVTINSLLGTSTAVEFRPVNTTVGATNPKWSGNGIILSYSPLSGKVGDMVLATIQIKCADGTGIVRAIA